MIYGESSYPHLMNKCRQVNKAFCNLYGDSFEMYVEKNPLDLLGC